MREETFIAVRYIPTHGGEVVVRLTYNVSEGPRPDIVRWFLVKQEVLSEPDSQSLNWRDDARQDDLERKRRAIPARRPEELVELLAPGTPQG